jgi:hypothetical protein
MYLGVRCPNGQCSVSTVSEFPTTALRWDAGAQGWVATGSVTGTQFQFKCSGVPQPTAFRVVLRPTASAQQNGALVASAIGGTYERTSPNGACGPATLKYAFRTTAGHPQP